MDRIRIEKLKVVVLSILAFIVLFGQPAPNSLASDGDECPPEMEETIIHFENCLFESFIAEIDNGTQYSFESFVYRYGLSTGFFCSANPTEPLFRFFCGEAVVGGVAISFDEPYVKDENSAWIPGGCYTLFRNIENTLIYFVPCKTSNADVCHSVYIVSVIDGSQMEANCPDPLMIGNCQFCVNNGQIILF